MLGGMRCAHARKSGEGGGNAAPTAPEEKEWVDRQPQADIKSVGLRLPVPPPCAVYIRDRQMDGGWVPMLCAWTPERTPTCWHVAAHSTSAGGTVPFALLRAHRLVHGLVGGHVAPSDTTWSR